MAQEEPILSIEDALKQRLSKDSSYNLKIEHSSQFPEPPDLPQELVKGVLRFGHKLVLAGPPDSGKTSMVLALGLAVSQGKPWLEMETTAAHVLFVNLELDPISFVNRVHQVAKATNLEASHKRFHFLHHRGGNLDPARFTSELRQQIAAAKLEGIEFKLVIIDPIYKLVGMGGADESSNLRTSRLISGLGEIAEFGKISFAITVDVAIDHPRFQITHEIENGTGQLARDADTLLSLWPLERHEAGFRLKAQMREFEAFKPMSLSFEFPCFLHNPDLDRVPIVGFVAQTAEEVSADIVEVNVWKIWDHLNSKEAVPLEQLAKLMNLSAFEARQKIMQAGPNPHNPNLKLRMAAGNKVKAEEG